MVDKIISGGQTGADRAALDVAIRMGIDHGGWIVSGRMAEDGPLDDAYQLEEIDTSDNDRRTEKNVIESEGTLIVSRGALTGGSATTREMAVRHRRPFIHADLKAVPAFEAARRVQAWIGEHGVGVLNVAGPRASEDPGIYQATADLLETVLHLYIVHVSMPGLEAFQPGNAPGESEAFTGLPRTVDQAVERLAGLLSFREKARLSKMSPEECVFEHPSLVYHIRNRFRLPVSNPELLEACREISGDPDFKPVEAEKILIGCLVEKIKRTHGLRRVK